MATWLRWLFEHIADAAAGVGEQPTEIAEDHVGPLLIPDLYWKDDRTPTWRALAEARGYLGAIVKATEGVTYYPAALDWFASSWRALRAVADPRYGRDWFRGAYHFLRFDQDGGRQAEFYLRTIERAGGWDPDGDILPIVDVELGGGDHANRRASKERVIDVTSRWIHTVKKATGREVILYGRGAMRDLGITDRMGARFLWNPSYTAIMKRAAIERIGWTLEDVALWQYTDGKVGVAKTKKGKQLPLAVPGFGAFDCSVFVGGRTIADFRRMLVDGR